MTLNDMFDAYGRVARLTPALLVTVPAVVVAYSWFPGVYNWLVGLGPVLVTLGAVVALAHFSRHRGQTVQQKLLVAWGDLPTTQMLHLSDDRIDTETKLRYHRRLEQLIPGWSVPDSALEAAEPEATKEKYRSAVNWLRENTRDRERHDLVFQENVSYGFRRNLFGLKPIGISVNVLALAAIALQVSRPDFEISGVTGKQIVGSTVVAMTLIVWVALITRRWVYSAAEAYARALLGAIDRI